MKILYLFLLYFSLDASGQSLKRQSTNTSGGSAAHENIRLSHTIGQPYDTKGSATPGTGLHAGFQQSVFSTQILFTEIEISLIPNPTLYEFSISTMDSLENIHIVVVDLAGKQVFTDSVKNLTNYRVYCADWANGTYMISLLNNDKKLATARLIKQN